MSTHDHDVPRRDFLKTGLLAGAASLAAGATHNSRALAAEAPSDAQPADALPTRPFGKTGRTLPILGMGGSAMTGMFIKAYGAELLPLDERVAMVRHAYDRGLRYFDTARVYGESESIVGRGLAGVRDQCYVATKVHITDPAQVRKSLETSLEQLQMSYVDVAQVHSPCIERVGVDGAMKIHAELVKLRDEGLCKFIGLTTHVAFEEVLTMIERGGFDQVLLAYGYFRKGMDTMLSNRKIELRDRCLAAAHERGMAIVAMKVLGANIFSHNAPNLVPDYDSGQLARLPAAAIRWVLQDDRVSMLNIGVSVPRDIDQNVATLLANHRLTPDDRRVLADFSARVYETTYVNEMKVT